MPLQKRSLAITDRYRAGLGLLTRQTLGHSKAEWNKLDWHRLDRSYVPISASISLTVKRAQQDAVNLTAGYLAAYLSSELGERVRTPKIRTADYVGKSFDGSDLDSTLERPIVKVKVAISEQQADPLGTGLKALLAAVDLSVKHAARQALQDAYTRDDRFIGWQRATSGTCEACGGAADGSTLPPGTPLNIHPNCECVAEGVVQPKSPAEVLADRSITTRAGLDEYGKPRYGDGRFTQGDNGYITEDYLGQWSSMDANNLLRHGPGEVPKVGKPALSDNELRKLIGKWDTAMEHAGPIGKSVRVFRGVHFSAEELKMKPGTVFTDPAFSSTSADRVVAQSTQVRGQGLKTIMLMNVSPKVKAVWAGEATIEKELILQRDCRYVIRSVEKKGDRWYVEMDVLPPA